MAYGIYITYVVEDSSQNKFDTGKTYKVGTNALFVYVNGLLTETENDYIEIDSKTIEFTDELQTGDRITITSSFISENSGASFAVVGKGNNALFKYYDDKTHLINNQTYSLDIDIGGKSFSYSFTSKYSPMFSSEKIIRIDLQEVLEDVSSDTINFTIWQNSQLALELTDSSGDYQYYTNADDIDTSDIPYYAKQWVRYKTELDLLDTIYINIASKLGSEKKKLGNMEVEKQHTLPYISDLKKGLTSRITPFERLLTGRNVIAASATKAGNTTYPLSDRRSF